MASKLLLTALLAGAALAKTDLNGCVSFETIITVPNRPDVYPYGSLIWYVPDTGEVCEFIDCGGGRAPPKTTVPGCGAYKGTETYSPKFIDPKTLGQAPQTDAATSVAVTESPAVTTESPSASAVASDVEDSSSAPVLTSLPTLTQTGSFVESLLTTTTATVAKTTAASEGSSSHKASSASDGAASSPAPTSSSVSTAAAGAMPTAGGMLALAAGAAVYAGMV
jgi:hypothetical protein